MSKDFEKPVEMNADIAASIAKALNATGDENINTSDTEIRTSFNVVEMLDKLLSSLHLRQKTNLKPAERNGLAAIDAQLVHRFERRGYVDTVKLKYADSFREHSVSIDNIGGNRIVSAIHGVSGSSTTTNNILPPQVIGK